MNYAYLGHSVPSGIPFSVSFYKSDGSGLNSMSIMKHSGSGLLLRLWALQAGFYFIYRAGFEDSNSHRKNLRRMRQSNKRTTVNDKVSTRKEAVGDRIGSNN